MTPIAPPSPEPRLPSASGARTPAETAREFEAVFVGQMTRIMLESVELSPEFSGGHGEEMFRGVLAEQLGTQMTQRGGLGISAQVLDQIIRMQEGSAGGR